MNAPEDFALALAYADDCLPDSKRTEFEKRLGAEPALRSQVAEWKAQNEAIRGAFGVRRTPVPRTLRLAVAANQNLQPSAAAPAPLARAAGPAAIGAPRWRPAARQAFLRPVRLGAAVTILAAAFVPSAPKPTDFHAGAIAAFKAYAGDNAGPAEFISSDADALKLWLTRRFAGRLDPPLQRAPYLLTGVRAAPGPSAPIAYVSMTRPDGVRFALLAAAGDAPAASAPLIEADGDATTAIWSDGRQILTLVGPGDVATILRLANGLSAPAR